ncbi:MAG: DUF4325 domain-containing protein [Lachnospiraceae bacterium]|nr:DUF4325 domain-containing protein [Lachnospiraceae bacterium]
MKVTDKKRDIILYILNKIEQNDKSISKSVSENFSINQNTVHTYINELVNENIIRRIKRGTYELVTTKNEYSFNIKEENIKSDVYIYSHYIEGFIKETGENIKKIWIYVLSEMLNNVLEHSEAENLRVTIEKNYLNTKVIFWDDGIGIFNKIKNYFDYDEIDEAVYELFKGKLTTDKKNHSGEGIFFSSRIMDKFVIVSSNKVFSSNKYDDNMFVNLLDDEFDGTCVLMELSNFSNKKMNDVFGTYTDEVGDFTKTSIPMKNIFDASPISRSQAKRVCDRLENFKEVVFDFSDVEWMGQGFAHQVFVVFSNQNPKIKLIPINMNDDVKKMYNHVMIGKGKADEQ